VFVVKDCITDTLRITFN